MPRALLVLLVVALGLPAPGVGAAPAARSRLYLLASAYDRTTSYGPVAAEAEAGAPASVCTTSDLEPGERRCRGGLSAPEGTFYTVSFLPQVRLEAPVAWSAATPMRYHLAVEVAAPLPATVWLGVQHGGALYESGPSTEVAPGVYEGTLATGSPMSPALATPIIVLVSSAGPIDRIEVGTAGGSWVDLPEAVAMSSAGELVASDTYAPAPETVTLGERTFEMSDGAWEATAFTGDLGATRNVAVTLTQPAAALLAWVDGFTTPVVYDLAHAGTTDPAELTQYPRLRLLRGTAVLAVGERAVGDVAMLAGTLTVEVSADHPQRQVSDPFAPIPYTGHVLVVYGTRTLRAMRWPLPSARWFQFRTPVAAICPGGSEPIPQAPAVASFAVTLAWDAVTPGHDWTITFPLPGVGDIPCGEHQTHDRLRLTFPGPRVWRLGPTPSPRHDFVSVEDVRFEMTARFTYLEQ